MPTLDGKLWLPSAVGYEGSFRVTPASYAMGSFSSVGLGITIDCGTGANAGLYSQVLLAGTYYVQIPGFPQFQIIMPSGSGDYAIEEVDVAGGDPGSPLSTISVYADAAALAAATLDDAVEWVVLREDSNVPAQQHALFFRSSHANVLAFTPDGINVCADLADVRFIRQGVDPNDLA